MKKQCLLQIQTVKPPPTEIIGLLSDCARMTREFYPTISVACLQLHYHVIPFLPLKSQLSQLYGSEIHSAIEIKEGWEQTWDPCVRVLEGHTDEGFCIAFSPDGEQLVSGSRDCTVRLWNISTGAPLQVMQGQ